MIGKKTYSFAAGVYLLLRYPGGVSLFNYISHKTIVLLVEFVVPVELQTKLMRIL